MSTLQEYKENRIGISDLLDYLAYATVYEWNKDATDEEVNIICSASKDAWLKDENGYSICKFVDFLSEHYFNGTITLDDIENASKWDIISDVTDDMICNIKNIEDEMER